MDQYLDMYTLGGSRGLDYLVGGGYIVGGREYFVT